MPSDQRIRDEQCVRVTTRRLLVGSLAATAAFGGLAAVASAKHASTTTPATQTHELQPGDDETYDESFDGGEATAPQQSFAPPVARSGGS